MIALNVTDIRTFMSALLAGNIFDEFLLTEGSVTTFCTWSVDGTWQNDFFDRDRKEDSESESAAEKAVSSYVPWKNVKEFFFSIIRGKRTPLSFKFVFCLSAGALSSFLSENGLSSPPSEIFGLYMNYRYDGSQLLLTTGTSLRTFTKDRSLDSAWDISVMAFLKQNGISTEQVQ